MYARRLLTVVICIIGVLACLAGSPALAEPTLAVLPLTKGAGSATYDGLGDALSGMIVSDLSQVPGLTLVERARLDALLTEIDLSESGFVDAKTAQRLGRGAGAELVLIGTYSVVDTRFLLDARIVRVEGGDIVKATAAQGTLDDFVTVEKDLVEGLLAGLDVAISSSLRRQLLIQAPTETFEALSAYGEGIARERAGELDAASAAYDRALEADPEFVAARRSLDRLRGALERSQARAAESSDTRRGKILEQLVAGSKPPSSKAPGDDPDALAALFLRWLALTDQRQDCVVAVEIDRWARSRDWKLPDRILSNAVYKAAQARATAAGFEPVPRDIPAPKPAYERIGTRTSALADPKRQLHLGAYFRDALDKDGLVGATARCHRGPARPEAIDRVFDGVRHLPNDAVGLRAGLSVAQLAELAWAHWYAVDVGPDRTLERRVAKLIADTESNDAIRGTIQQEAKLIAADARELQLRRIRRAGATRDQILAFATALQAQDAAVIDLDRGVCRQMVQNERPRGAILRSSLDNVPLESRSWHSNLDQIALQRRTLGLVGCLDGVAAEWRTPDALRAGLQARLEHLTPGAHEDSSCASTLASLQTQLSDEHVAKVKTWASGEDSWTWAVLTMYLAIEGSGCVDVPGS